MQINVEQVHNQENRNYQAACKDAEGEGGNGIFEDPASFEKDSQFDFLFRLVNCLVPFQFGYYASGFIDGPADSVV